MGGQGIIMEAETYYQGQWQMWCEVQSQNANFDISELEAKFFIYQMDWNIGIFLEIFRILWPLEDFI